MPPKRPLVSDDEDEYDDLDELGSEEEEEDIKPGDIKQILKGSLIAPSHSTINMRHLNDMIQSGDVELNPEFQRDVVWSEAKQIGLIQSIFLNFYVPPIIFALFVDAETGQQTRVCLDGKQRCTSIVNFMSGQIPFISPTTKERFWFAQYGNKKRGMQLPEVLKRQFETRQIYIAEYLGISDTQQRDIFQRVQMGMSLSAAEKLQAIPGPWPIWINELIKKYVSEPETLKELDWDQTRGRPFQNLAGFIIMAHDCTKPTIPSSIMITRFLERNDPPDQFFRKKVEMALSLFVNIATEHFADSLGVVKKRLAPAEFCYIALLIFTRMGVMSIARLAKSIGNMRTYIRHDKGHVDVRSNTRISNDFAEYVRSLPKSLQHGEQPAAEEFEGDEVDPRDVRAAKRARRGEETDPTYRDTAVDRYDEAGLGNATRGAKAKTKVPTPVPSSARPSVPQAYAPQPAPMATRPSAGGMDRTDPAQINGSFGQMSQSSSSHNPYTTQYSQPQQQQQQQQQQSYSTNAQFQPQPQAHPRPQPSYTPEQIAHFRAMQQNQQRQLQQQQQQNQAAPRWASRQ